jgi:hypothetical protein
MLDKNENYLLLSLGWSHLLMLEKHEYILVKNEDGCENLLGEDKVKLQVMV